MPGNFWKQLIQPVQRRQQALNKVSIDWCLPILFFGEKQNDTGHASWQFNHCLTFTRILLFQLGFGWYVWFLVPKTFLYPRQLSHVIASLKHMWVVWFCLVLNMFCHTGVISANRVNHLIWMCMSCCNNFAEHSKEACCDTFLLHNQISSAFLTVPLSL